MIFGVGTDVVEIERIKRALERFGERFAKRVLCEPELKRIQTAGDAIRKLGMRFNAGHALNYFNVQPIAALNGVRELHIGHAIVSRAVFVGMREAVREMKRLIVDAAR